ncbi:hypothetical protein C8J57DRAFT_1529437 [Mycena rebaudengoi]|nr:hypothetical protein C8J57DRAFT_1529437 [Mycena rebaudengoi]
MVVRRHSFLSGLRVLLELGRNRAAAERILASFPAPTVPGIRHEFVPSDTTLMRNVRATSAALLARFPPVNMLVLSPGIMTLAVRDDTTEGLDRKLALHYYAPAHAAGEDVRIMSVLVVSHGGPVDLDCLGLTNAYTLGCIPPSP